MAPFNVRFISMVVALIAMSALLGSRQSLAQDHGHEHDDDHAEMEVGMIFNGTNEVINVVWSDTSGETPKMTFALVGDGITCGEEELEEAEEHLGDITDEAHVHSGDIIVPPAIIDMHVPSGPPATFHIQLFSNSCFVIFSAHELEEYAITLRSNTTGQLFVPTYVHEHGHGTPRPTSGSLSLSGGLLGGLISAIAVTFTL